MLCLKLHTFLSWLVDDLERMDVRTDDNFGILFFDERPGCRMITSYTAMCEWNAHMDIVQHEFSNSEVALLLTRLLALAGSDRK